MYTFLTRKNRTGTSVLGLMTWWLIGGFFILYFIGPFLWMIFTSFKVPSEVIAFPPTLIPRIWTFENYVRMWAEFPWLRLLWNSVWITTVSVFGILFLNSLAAFAFAKLRFPLRNTLFLLVIGGLIVPEQVDMIPRFLMMVSMGLTGTFIPVILLIVAQGFQCFMMRQFISTIPDDFLDAAKIDGMGYWQMYLNIILPLAKAGIIVVMIFSTFMVWNQYVYPLIYLTRPEMYTVQLGLGMLQQRIPGNFGIRMAGASFVAAPTLIVYLIFQRHLASGILMGGLKG